MQAVYFFAINNFIMFAPLYFNLYGIIDVKAEKLYFSLTVFGVIVFGGYCTLNALIAYIHFSDKRVKIINLKKYIFKSKNDFKIKGLEVFRVQTQARCGVNNFAVVNAIGVFNTINSFVVPIIIEKKNFLKIRNDFTITCDNQLCYYLKIGFFINMFSLLNALANSILKKVISYVRKQK